MLRGMNKQPLRTAATALGLVALAGCAGGTDLSAETAQQTDQVDIPRSAFEPAVVEVPAGTTVTWTFTDNTDHNVVGEGFESDVLSDGTFTHTFTEAGTYDYQCTLHGGMRGRVVVADA